MISLLMNGEDYSIDWEHLQCGTKCEDTLWRIRGSAATGIRSRGHFGRTPQGNEANDECDFIRAGR